MRIISKEFDFYDCVQRHNDHSDDVIYVRKPVEIESRETLIPHFHYYFPRLIGFCGRVYLLVVLHGKACYTLEECDEVAQNFDEPEKEKYFGINRKGWSTYSNRGRLKTFFNKFKTAPYLDLFQKHRIPIFTIKQESSYSDGYNHTNSTIVLNDTLNKFEFYRIFNPYAAFQEIEMYMSGPLAPRPKEIPTLSDEVKIAAGGFDVKTSFRKPKRK